MTATETTLGDVPAGATGRRAAGSGADPGTGGAAATADAVAGAATSDRGRSAEVAGQPPAPKAVAGWATIPPAGVAAAPVGAPGGSAGEPPPEVTAPLPAPPAAVAPPPVEGALPADPAAACPAMLAAVGVLPPPGWVVRCEGARSGIAAEANPTRRDVIVYVRPAWSLREAARILAHELGHAFDWALLADHDRSAWMDARGLGGGWGSDCPAGSICGDTDRPAGDWAEAVGELLVPGTDLWSSQLGGPPSPAQLELVRAILGSHGVLA